MLAFGGANSGIFKLLLVLHILSAIVGHGRRDAQRSLRRAGAETPGTSGPCGLRGELRGSQRRREGDLPDPGVRHPARALERFGVFEFSPTRLCGSRSCCSSARWPSRTPCSSPGTRRSTACCSRWSRARRRSAVLPRRSRRSRSSESVRARGRCDVERRRRDHSGLDDLAAGLVTQTVTARRAATRRAAHPGRRRRAGSPCRASRWPHSPGNAARTGALRREGRARARAAADAGRRSRSR